MAVPSIPPRRKSISSLQNKVSLHYVNGKFVREEDAKISLFDLGLLRGFGVFDYVRLFQGKPFHLLDHLLRLQWSADQARLPLPMNVEKIYELALRLIEKNDSIDAGLRFLVTGGVSFKDQILPEEGSNLAILFHPFSPLPERYYTEGMRVVTTDLIRLLPSIKTTNYMPAIFAMKKSLNLGFDDALYLNDRKMILEGTTCNVFFFKDGIWRTDDSNQIIKGITRKVILELIQDQYPIEFKSIHWSELESCEEAFLCSSVKDVVPLVQIEDRKIGRGIPGPHTANVRKIYRNYIQKYFSSPEPPN